MTFSIKTLSITVSRMKTISIKIFSIKTLGIKTLSMTIENAILSIKLKNAT